MSSMKQHLADVAARRALEQLVHDMERDQRESQAERLERLAWEAQRAVNDYLDALKQFEADRADESGRRADEMIDTGQLPF